MSMSDERSTIINTKVINVRYEYVYYNTDREYLPASNKRFTLKEGEPVDVLLYRFFGYDPYFKEHGKTSYYAEVYDTDFLDTTPGVIFSYGEDFARITGVEEYDNRSVNITITYDISSKATESLPEDPIDITISGFHAEKVCDGHPFVYENPEGNWASNYVFWHGDYQYYADIYFSSAKQEEEDSGMLPFSCITGYRIYNAKREEVTEHFNITGGDFSLTLIPKEPSDSYIVDDNVYESSSPATETTDIPSDDHILEEESEDSLEKTSIESPEKSPEEPQETEPNEASQGISKRVFIRPEAGSAITVAENTTESPKAPAKDTTDTAEAPIKSTKTAADFIWALRDNPPADSQVEDNTPEKNQTIDNTPADKPEPKDSHEKDFLGTKSHTPEIPIVIPTTESKDFSGTKTLSEIVNKHTTKAPESSTTKASPEPVKEPASTAQDSAKAPATTTKEPEPVQKLPGDIIPEFTVSDTMKTLGDESGVMKVKTLNIYENYPSDLVTIRGTVLAENVNLIYEGPEGYSTIHPKISKDGLFIHPIGRYFYRLSPKSVFKKLS